MTLVLAGRLLGTAFACGLNLYATVALLGIASRVGWVDTLPPGMIGLEHGFVIGCAAVLYVIEFVVDRIPVIDHAWEAVHTLIRPAAAGLLTMLALNGMPLGIVLAGGAAGTALALAAHGSKAGLRLIVSTRGSEARRRSLARIALGLLEDIAAVGLAVAALLFPRVAIGVTAASLALILLAGPRLWRAAILGLRAVLARARGFFNGRGWRYRDQLPRGFRSVVPGEPLGSSPLRAASAAVAGLPGIGEYRNGWLVLTWQGPRFLYRSLFRTRAATLPPISRLELRRGIVTDVLDLNPGTNGANGARKTRSFTIFLLKDGPPPAVTAAELKADRS